MQKPIVDAESLHDGGHPLKNGLVSILLCAEAKTSLPIGHYSMWNPPSLLARLLSLGNDEGERADNFPPSECTSDTHPRDVPEHPH
ncbi:hypothetical protein TNCT_104761 [Trichonephila clavata]|uniref:Uncharacterized protein n=1 Tax=Trichonephila clavata TaxID=2740835 RepID=A0A8X6H9N3_TRICU|nr:hypothetical protein TNCT_104761 [Trichonephila clavata]